MSSHELREEEIEEDKEWRDSQKKDLIEILNEESRMKSQVIKMERDILAKRNSLQESKAFQ